MVTFPLALLALHSKTYEDTIGAIVQKFAADQINTDPTIDSSKKKIQAVMSDDNATSCRDDEIRVTINAETTVLKGAEGDTIVGFIPFPFLSFCSNFFSLPSFLLG